MNDQSLESNNTFDNTLQNISLISENLREHVSNSSDTYDLMKRVIAPLFFFYCVISFIALIGNLCVVVIVFTVCRMRNITNSFIAILAVADTMTVILVVPFQFNGMLFKGRLLSPFACKVFLFIQELSVNVSILTLTAIALDRFRAVVFPLKARSSKLCAKVKILSIWLISALAAGTYVIPLGLSIMYNGQIANEKTKPFDMGNNISPFGWKIYKLLMVTLQYIVPLSLISIMYIKIAIKLRGCYALENIGRNREENTNNKEKEIKMLIFVVLLFALCHLPFQLYRFLQEIFPKIDEYKHINIIRFCFPWFTLINSGCNPIMYALFNKRFKDEFKMKFNVCIRFLRRCFTIGQRASDLIHCTCQFCETTFQAELKTDTKFKITMKRNAELQ